MSFYFLPSLRLKGCWDIREESLGGHHPQNLADIARTRQAAACACAALNSGMATLAPHRPLGCRVVPVVTGDSHAHALGGDRIETAGVHELPQECAA